MKIFIKTSNNKDLFIVFNWLGSEELFWLFQAALIHSQNHICLGVEVKAIANPSIISSKDENF